jgi:hypothetical protein
MWLASLDPPGQLFLRDFPTCGTTQRLSLQLSKTLIFRCFATDLLLGLLLTFVLL